MPEAGVPVTDHPRRRGEHDAVMHHRARFLGSSPHTRGAHQPRQHAEPTHRIIPAYAGSTRPGPSCPTTRTDHPRIRGEHAADRQYLDSYEGSSPHTRGARPAACPGPCRRRIIPAYAGSTASAQIIRYHSRDHPRIRGEHETAARARPRRVGSSPHTRGAPGCSGCWRGCGGIIPAYAGSTSRP